MALLIDIGHSNWMEDEELRAALLKHYPQGDIRCASNPGNLDQIEMIAVSNWESGKALRYPNLKLVQKTGAGVDNILDDDALPESIQVSRLESDSMAQEMAEYCLACVLLEQRHFRKYQHHQSRRRWQAVLPRRAGKTTVAILGLGKIGKITAQRFVDNGFNVIGWSQSKKLLPGVECYFSVDQFPVVLKFADYVVSILPSTPDTRYLFDAETFALMKPEAVLINCGRGDLIDEVALIEALDTGLLATAILNVMQTEPLPLDSPMWQHANIVLTPHIAGWHVADAVSDIAQNLRRLDSGKPLLHLVDRKRGY